jgi:hypothetical protein
MSCHACGAPLSAQARFCHKCGAAVGTAHVTGWRAGLPWGTAGAALGALVAVLVMRASGAPARSTEQNGSAPSSVLRAPDISQMSPEERATRLFDRVMILAEAGKRDSVRFFLPMALGAYAQLPALDLDARYDIGVLHLSGADAAGALAQADTILKAVPTHLYGFMLRARAYELRNDARSARQAYAAFLRNEAAERARQRPEYAEHEKSIDAFHGEAVRVAGARPAS